MPLFPGSEFLALRNRPNPTDPQGASLVDLLSPGIYQVTVPSRRDVRPVPATVSEGAETLVPVTLP